MSNLKISQLNELTIALSGDTLPIVNSGETKKITVNNLIGSAITGSINHIAYFNSNKTLASQPNLYLTNAGNTFGVGTNASTPYEHERLMVDAGGSYNIATFQTSKQNSYAEVNIKNFGSGSNASADLILWNDVSTESSSFVDLGINSSNYNGSSVGFGGDGYLFNQANDMYIGSVGTGTHGHTHIFAGNHWNSSSISIYQDGTIGFGTDWLNNNATTIPTSGYTYEFSGSIKLDNNIKVDGYIQGDANIYLQPDIDDVRNIQIYNTQTTDIHIKGNSTYTYFGDDRNYLKIDNSGETITINSNSGTTLNGIVILSQVANTLNFTDDNAAASGGVPVGGLYRNGNFVMIRLT